MGSVVSPTRRATGIAMALAAAGVLLLAAIASIPNLLFDNDCADAAGAEPSRSAGTTIPTTYLELYRRAGAAYGVPWTVLAAIGAIESDHGRSPAPGVRSGVNAFGCCAGPMQFNL